MKEKTHLEKLKELLKDREYLGGKYIISNTCEAILKDKPENFYSGWTNSELETKYYDVYEQALDDWEELIKKGIK